MARRQQQSAGASSVLQAFRMSPAPSIASHVICSPELFMDQGTLGGRIQGSSMVISMSYHAMLPTFGSFIANTGGL